VIEFRLTARSNAPPYLQIVEQVRQALRMGLLEAGDQLPTVREVAESIAINPNTVLKAYRELERDGFVHSRPGAGTFVSNGAPAPLARSVHAPLRKTLDRWLAHAHEAHLDRESVIALFTLALQDAYGSEETHAKRS
jgi:GntR family transcriptional regulator